MPWIFHPDLGAGKVRSRRGGSLKAKFRDEVREMPEGSRTVPDDSSWVLASENPNHLIELLRDDPWWIVREQLEDTWKDLTVEDVTEHLSLLDLDPEVVEQWRNAIADQSNGSDEGEPGSSGGGPMFPFGPEDPKSLRKRLLTALGEIADTNSTGEERLLAHQRITNLSQKKGMAVSPGDATIAKILRCDAFEDSTPLPKVKLSGVGKKFFEDLIASCQSTKDCATLVLIAGPVSYAKLAAKSLTDEDRASLDNFLVAHLEEADEFLREKKRRVGAWSNAEIKRMLKRFVLVAGNDSAPVMAAILRARVAAKNADNPKMVIAIDRFADDVGPTLETLREAADSTKDLPPVQRAACLNSLPFEPGSTRVRYLEALLDDADKDLLDRPEPWEKVTLDELAGGWPDDDVVITAMLGTDKGWKIASNVVNNGVSRMGSKQLGLILSLHPDVRALISEKSFEGGLTRLVKRNPNVAQLPDLFAQEATAELREELEQEKSDLEKRHSEEEAGFRATISERDAEITALKADIKQAQSHIASHTSEVRSASAAELRQAKVDALKGCAEAVRDLQSEQGNEEALEKLELVLGSAGLVLLDRPDDIVTFEPARHERLIEGTNPRVVVVLSAIGFAEGQKTTVIQKGLVTDHA